MSSKTIENHVIEEVTKHLVPNIDVRALAIKLAPKVQANIEKGIVQYFENYDYDDLLYSSAAMGKVMEQLLKNTADELLKASGIEVQKKGGKKK